MTRLPLSTNGRAGPSRVAALHARGDALRLVVVEVGERARVVETRDLDAGDERLVTEVVRAARAEAVVWVVPASETTCRLVEAPLTGDDAQDAPAIALLAETQLAESLPAHRRAGGVVPAPERPLGSVLLTGWPERSGDAPAAPWSMVTHAVAEPAALALLAGPEGGVSWSADRQSGSVCVVAHGPDRSVVRALLVENEDAEAWGAGVREAVGECVGSAGVAAPPIEGGVRLSAGTALDARVAGADTSEAWMDAHAIALGAAMVVGSPATTASLGSLRHEAPRLREPAHRRVAAWLASPRHAWGTIAACVLLVLLGPLAASWGRLAILEAKSARLAERREALESVQRRAALYRQLEQTRWPMTKLLADVAGATPVGITADSVRISTSQHLRFEGTAEREALIVALQQALADTGVFGDVRIDSTDGTPGSVGFALSARVVRPLSPATPAQDFAEQTLAERLHGEGASNTAFEPGSAPSTRRASTRRPVRRDSVDDERDAGGASRAGARPTPSDDPVPEALTDEQIRALGRLEAGRAMVARRTYLQKNEGVDAETRRRLEDEIRRLRTHLTSGDIR